MFHGAHCDAQPDSTHGISIEFPMNLGMSMGISHELMPISAGGSDGMPRQTPEVSTMSPVVCACVRRWDDGSCRTTVER